MFEQFRNDNTDPTKGSVNKYSVPSGILIPVVLVSVLGLCIILGSL